MKLNICKHSKYFESSSRELYSKYVRNLNSSRKQDNLIKNGQMTQTASSIQQGHEKHSIKLSH